MGCNSASFQLISLMLLSIVLYLETNKFGFCHGDINVQCMGTERKALLEFKEGLTDPFGMLVSWVGEDCCRWEGVSCNNRTRHVTMIKLGNSNPSSFDGDGLGGEISPSLLHLKELTHLDLSGNNFGGVQIPNFIGSLDKLRYLNLSGASFIGVVPPNLGNISSLLYLDLSNELIESDLRWLSCLSSLKYLNLGGVDLTKAAAYWLQTVNMLPSLIELHLPNCRLSNLPLTLPLVNFTFLSVLDLSTNDFNSCIPYWFFNVGRLQCLNLKSNNLQGELPEAFANMNSLQKLDLSHNSYIQGQLPKEFGKLCNLQTLDLSFNNISGEITDFIDGLSDCINSSLETLKLGYNRMTGNLPGSLGYLNNLRYLQLWQNSFRGPIPPSIGNLSSLEEFYLYDNQMNGIPESLGQLSSLVVLDLSENPWEGVLTEAHFLNLSRLKQLSITKVSPNISLSFNISSGWIPPFKLRYINIRSCQLGPKFPAWLRNQNELNTLVLNNARISDTIPDWFWQLNLQLDELDVAYNQLRGKVPNSFGFNNPSTVDLSSNRFEGPLPLWSGNVTMLYLNDNMFSGPLPRDLGKVMSLLTDSDFSWNSLNGRVPLSIGKLNDLITLAISNNNLVGEIPQFWNNTPYLSILDMSNNSLSGTIPRSLGFLSSLLFLILSNNNLSGEIPPSLRNCTYMDSLDLGYNRLSGNIPAWIGESMPELHILRLRSNFFTENIPSQVCNLPSLHILDLSQNNLSGKIPTCIGNLSSMKSKLSDTDEVRYEGRLDIVAKGTVLEYQSTLYLVKSVDLSINNLSGDLPVELTRLVELGTLNLSMNHFTGRIPIQIGNLQRLETLDLSRNKLSGHIPLSMASQTFLNHLNLSNNNLSGKIPTANQFQTLTDPSIYEGNLALCGFPLPVKCPGTTDETPDQFPGKDEEDRDDEDEDDFDKLSFFISMVLGFFVGFWGVFGTLIIKKSWRYAFFSFLNQSKDTFLTAVSVKIAHLNTNINSTPFNPKQSKSISTL